jgi:Protein of unknown function (DUF3800)
MVLHAYIDESGVGKELPMLLLGGFIGKAKAWKKIEISFNALLDEFGLDDFHTIDLMRGRRQFRKWPWYKRDSLLMRAHDLAKENLELSFVTVLNRADYQNHYRAQFSGNRKPPLSEYGVSLSVILSVLTGYSIARKNNQKVDFILDRNEQNVGAALDIFKRFEDRLPDAHRAALGGLVFTRRAENRLICVADLLCYTVYRAINRRPAQLGMLQFRNNVLTQTKDMVSANDTLVMGLDKEILNNLSSWTALDASIDYWH